MLTVPNPPWSSSRDCPPHGLWNGHAFHAPDTIGALHQARNGSRQRFVARHCAHTRCATSCTHDQAAGIEPSTARPVTAAQGHNGAAPGRPTGYEQRAQDDNDQATGSRQGQRPCVADVQNSGITGRRPGAPTLACSRPPT